MNITKLLITAFFINRLRWLLLGTASNRRHSEKNLRQNSKENILRNSFSVDIEVYALQLKQKSTTGVFHGVLWNFRTVTFDNKPWGGVASEKKTEEETGEQWTLWNQVFTFPGPLFIKSWNLFSNLLFHNSNDSTILLVQIIKVKHNCLRRVSECATKPLVNNMTKST